MTIKKRKTSYFFLLSVMCLIALLLFSPNALAGFYEIIDNDSPYFVMDGDWYESTTVDGYYGDNYLWTYGGMGDAGAKWVFQLPSNGYYQVFAWWPGPYGTRSPETRYTIKNDDGVSMVVMDQTENGGQWNELGAFYFPEGPASVSMENDANGNPVADAIRIATVSGKNIAREFIWPIEEQDVFIFQGFGNERAEGFYHSGTDFGVYKFNAKIRCIANGWVENINKGFGNSIMIKHILPDGEVVYSWYNHMANSVEEEFRIGEFVPVGTVLGIVGETGFSPSGIHTHLEIKRSNNWVGGYISDLSWHYNPYEFILSRLTFLSDPPEQCNDGTTIGDCSAERPFHCIDGGIMVENSLLCGCETGVPQTDGSCSHSEDGIIVDNNDIGFEKKGDWERRTMVMGFYGTDYLIAHPGDGNISASWTPNIPMAGYYSVYGWWRDRFSAEQSERAANVPIIIYHAGRQDQAVVDFTDYTKEWKYIGTYFFEEGTGNDIHLSNIPEGDVVADAFGFVWYTYPPPISGFAGAATAGISPLKVSFTDTSTGEIEEWLWDFGDGGSSDAQNPDHEYTVPGVYSVSLSVTGPGGTDIRTIEGYISVIPAPPISGFAAAATAGISPLKVSFTDTSTGEIEEWFWNFGDSATSTDQNPTSHKYTVPGVYSVSLTVTGPGGTDTMIIEDYISVYPAPPVAVFRSDATAGTVPFRVSFADTSTGEIEEWLWDFGDGGISDAQSPSHEYELPGDYTVSLTVTGTGGMDTRTINDYVSVLPSPSITVDPSETPVGGDGGGGGGCFISLTGL